MVGTQVGCHTDSRPSAWQGLGMCKQHFPNLVALQHLQAHLGRVIQQLWAAWELLAIAPGPAPLRPVHVGVRIPVASSPG